MKDDIKRGRLLYIVEAAVEYLIAILVAGQFLATLTNELGLDDSLTGILSSIISLGCLFQLFSMVFRKNKMKKFVIGMSILNQLLFMFLYVIPIVPLSGTAKTVIFVVFILMAYLIYYVAHPKKVAWLMGLVPDNERGKFTADKEIFSLIVGSLFSFGMGTVFDYFTEKGDTRTALVIGAVTIFLLTVGHTLTMLFTVEKRADGKEAPTSNTSLRESFVALMKNRRMGSVIFLFVMYNVGNYAIVPFLYTYQTKELSFSLSMIAILGVLGSISRILVSRFWGKYADRTSFANMMEKCLLIMAISYLCIAFATPATGIVALALYYIFHSIAMGGTNSALINLTFDYVPFETRSDSLAICQAISGVIGFLSTLGFSALLDFIQKNGFELFGIQIYAQQLLAAFSVVWFVLTALFVRFVILKKQKSN